MEVSPGIVIDETEQVKENKLTIQKCLPLNHLKVSLAVYEGGIVRDGVVNCPTRWSLLLQCAWDGVKKTWLEVKSFEILFGSSPLVQCRWDS